MKYLFIIITASILLLGCSNPVDTCTSYEVHYELHASGELGIWQLTAEYFNPQTGYMEYVYWPSSGWTWFPNAETYTDYVAHSGQTLFIQNVAEEGIGWVEIWVDGEIVAESIVADSVYVEWTLE